MSLQSTPMGDRVHIGIFGRRNAGKSSILNALTKQNLSIVSEVLGTTTDPVYKAMELLPLGPVMLIDTPGLDDEGTLGKQRVQKSLQVLNKTDIALLVLDGAVELSPVEQMLLKTCQERLVPCVVAVNKSDLSPRRELTLPAGVRPIYVSAKTGENIDLLKETLASLAPSEPQVPLVSDLIAAGEVAVLVTPIDSSAPKGRLILPQQQTIRELLDHGSCAVVCQPSELSQMLGGLSSPPALVITDSQVFEQVENILPGEVPLTSFSILFARKKGLLSVALAGVAAVSRLQDGDRVLICEGCTHHRQCEDIGTVKLPRLLCAHTKKELAFSFASGREFPLDLSPYALVVHCGGCMLTGRDLLARVAAAEKQGVPMTNYGVLIAHLKGILPRSVAPLGIVL